MELKAGNILVKWLDKKMSYIRQEKTAASTAGYYDRGQIVFVDLGFNVGSEKAEAASQWSFGPKLTLAPSP